MASTISSIKQLIYTQEGQIDEQKGVAANLAAVEVGGLQIRIFLTATDRLPSRT